MNDDYISRADILKERQTFAVLGIPDLVDAVLIEDIETIPAADVRPVVLCRDCKHYNPSNRDWKCERSMGLVDPDEEDFCSLGERRESDHIADDGKKVDPCADCRWSPPSSGDGKPCCACDPDDPLMNCYERREDT